METEQSRHRRGRGQAVSRYAVDATVVAQRLNGRQFDELLVLRGRNVVDVNHVVPHLDTSPDTATYVDEQPLDPAIVGRDDNFACLARCLVELQGVPQPGKS